MTDTITLPRADAKEILRALRTFDAGAMIKAEEVLITALAQQAEQGWQPIESAPKDAVILLGLPLIGNIIEGDRRVYEGRWHQEQKTWTSVNGIILLTVATHWAQLPIPPAAPPKEKK